MKSAINPPEGYVLHKEWKLRTFSPYRYGRENNSFVSVIILFPILILLLPKGFMLSENETAIGWRQLLWMLLLAVAAWLVWKVFTRLLSGCWSYIRVSSIGAFPCWNGAAPKKAVDRSCVVAPLLTLGLCFAAYYLISPLFIFSIVFITGMLVVGINISFKLMDEPDQGLVAIEGAMLRVYVPERLKPSGSTEA